MTHRADEDDDFFDPGLPTLGSIAQLNDIGPPRKKLPKPRPIGFAITSAVIEGWREADG